MPEMRRCWFFNGGDRIVFSRCLTFSMKREGSKVLTNVLAGFKYYITVLIGSFNKSIVKVRHLSFL